MTLENAIHAEWGARLEELVMQLHDSCRCEEDDNTTLNGHPHHMPEDIFGDLDDCWGGDECAATNYVYGALMSLDRILRNADLAIPSNVMTCEECEAVMAEGTAPNRAVARTHR